MMKALTMKFLGAVTAASILASCGGGNSGGSGKPVVFVSVLPQAGFVKKIAGDLVDVEVLVGPGQDPHHHALAPQQAVALGKAQVLFTIGMPFENTLIDTVRNGKSALKIIDSTAGIEKIASLCDHEDHHDEEGHDHEEGHGHEEGHDHEDHAEGHDDEGGDHDHDHHHHEDDPHVWTSPELIKTVAANMAKALSEIDADNKATYEANLAEFEEELDTLHGELKEKMAPHEGRGFYVYHPAFGYFAQSYGMEQVSVEVGGQTPTPKELAEFLDHAKEDGIKVLFVQPQFDTRSAKTIADALGAQVVSLDPLEEDVPANLRRIADAIDKAFR